MSEIHKAFTQKLDQIDNLKEELRVSKNQIELLRKCIAAARSAECRLDELVEIGQINGVHPKTAESLVVAGLLVYDMPSWATDCTSTHVRLPNRDEFKWQS
jgi:hypothetical protein